MDAQSKLAIAEGLIADIKACTTAKALEVLGKAPKFAGPLNELREAGAEQQVNAVVSYQEERRRELELADG